MDVSTLYDEAKRRYWQEKDLAAARRLLEEGIALARTQGRPDLEKPLQYDLASFCWPGWDEPGIAPSPEDLEAGTAAAKANLSLAKALKRDHAGMANAWWMVGAYRLAQGRHRSAIVAFAHQSDHLRRAQNREGVLLAAGYIAVAQRAMGDGSMLESVLERLRASEGPHGAGFAAQVETAARLFGKTVPRAARKAGGTKGKP